MRLESLIALHGVAMCGAPFQNSEFIQSLGQKIKMSATKLYFKHFRANNNGKLSEETTVTGGKKVLETSLNKANSWSRKELPPWSPQQLCFSSKWNEWPIQNAQFKIKEFHLFFHYGCTGRLHNKCFPPEGHYQSSNDLLLCGETVYNTLDYNASPAIMDTRLFYRLDYDEIISIFNLATSPKVK